MSIGAKPELSPDYKAAIRQSIASLGWCAEDQGAEEDSPRLEFGSLRNDRDGHDSIELDFDLSVRDDWVEGSSAWRHTWDSCLCTFRENLEFSIRNQALDPGVQVLATTGPSPFEQTLRPTECFVRLGEAFVLIELYCDEEPLLRTPNGDPRPWSDLAPDAAERVVARWLTRYCECWRCGYLRKERASKLRNPSLPKNIVATAQLMLTDRGLEQKIVAAAAEALQLGEESWKLDRGGSPLTKAARGELRKRGIPLESHDIVRLGLHRTELPQSAWAIALAQVNSRQ